MATEADHIALANRNHEALLHLLPDVERFPEWVTVVAFYKAVQVVEAMLCQKTGRCAHGHEDRLQKLKSFCSKHLYRHYRVLWSASCVARYLYDNDNGKKYCCFTDYMSAAQVEKTIVKKRLHGVECEAVRDLSEKAKHELHRTQN